MKAVECITYWHHAIELEPGLVQALDPEGNVWFFKSCAKCGLEVVTQAKKLDAPCTLCIKERSRDSGTCWYQRNRREVLRLKSLYYEENRARICETRRARYHRLRVCGVSSSRA